VANGTVTHNGDRVLAEHVTNARRRVHPHLRDERGLPMWTITKDRPMSPRKIDAAMAVTLAAEARRDAIAAGVLNRRTKRQAVFL
jgi:phage terminase large subunit-like protein